MAPFFSFFGRDFLASTLGWSAEERGHYVTLLIAQWEQDGLPADPKRLELISPGVGRCWAMLEGKFPIGRDGRRRNARLEHERHQARERSERARQSAAARWSAQSPPPAPAEAAEAPAANLAEPPPAGGKSCDGICSAHAAIPMSYSPPPPPPPPEAEAAESGSPWAVLRGAWNAEFRTARRQWRSIEPPPAAVERLAEPGWLEDALRAIPEIRKGACARFENPPTLSQFCDRDPVRGSFVARLLGGEFSDPERVGKRDFARR